MQVEAKGLRQVYFNLGDISDDLGKKALETAMGIAADGRKIASSQFFNRPLWEGLRYGTKERGRSQTLTYDAKQGFKDRRGRRLIDFTAHAASKRRVSAHLSSYPMNLWEFPTKNGRPGLGIMTKRLVPIVQAVVPKHVARAEQNIQKHVDATMGDAQ